MNEPVTRVARVCDALNRHEARYVVFGATALQLWGSARATRDIEILVEPTVENARKVVAYLDAHEAVEWVAYPELPGHPDHELAKMILPHGCGAIFSFELKGGREAGRRFIEALRLFSHLANVGDAKSLVIHPGSTTHQQMDDAALAAAGVTEGLVRLSVGLEDSEDLLEDLGRALKASQRGR